MQLTKEKREKYREDFKKDLRKYIQSPRTNYNDQYYETTTHLYLDKKDKLKARIKRYKNILGCEDYYKIKTQIKYESKI